MSELKYQGTGKLGKKTVLQVPPEYRHCFFHIFYSLEVGLGAHEIAICRGDSAGQWEQSALETLQNGSPSIKMPLVAQSHFV